MAPSLDPDQRRSAIIVGSVIAGLLVLVGVAVAVSSGDNGNDTNKVEVNRTSTTSPSTSTSSSTTTSTTLSVLTAPPTAPPTTPPTVVIIPPTAPLTAPPTAPATAPPTVAPATTGTTAPRSSTSTSSSTTTSTTRPAGEQELNDALELALNGGVAPDPGTQARVNVRFEPGTRVRVTWALDPTLTTSKQKIAVRQEAFILLRTIQAANLSGDDPIVLRATLPDPDTGDPHRVARVVYNRSTLDGIDFTTVHHVDPQHIFDFADEVTLDPPLGTGTPSTTTSTSD